ncbi:MAG: Swt1 family HEPN domain-containing protein [Planctomycetaceae bacterium]
MRVAADPVRAALDELKDGLLPFIQREMAEVYDGRWTEVALQGFRDRRGVKGERTEPEQWDLALLLSIMWDEWNQVFRRRLGFLERSYVSELREFRNRWAHQEEFAFEDAYRILDTSQRLLSSVESPARAERLRHAQRDMMRAHVHAEARAAYLKAKLWRRKLQDVLIYITCAVTAVLGVTYSAIEGQWPLSTLIVCLFAYFIYRRLRATTPMFSDPHECVACGRIIYSTACPYCERIPDVENPRETANSSQTAR